MKAHDKKEHVQIRQNKMGDMGHPCRTPLACSWEEWVYPDTTGKSRGAGYKD